MRKGAGEGVVVNKSDPLVCMVADCKRKALYRSGKQTTRGYCATHKNKAVLRWEDSTFQSHSDFLQRNIRD